MSEPIALRDRRARSGHLASVADAGGLLVTPPDAHPLLVRASEEVLRGWAQAVGEAFDHEETEGILQWLRRSVDEAAKGLAPERGRGASAVGRFLLDRMASVLLGLLINDRTIDRDEALSLLQGIDAVRRVIEPEWDRYFASQLSGPDGLNIVVEVAHDIRSPLTSIRCLAETLERGQSGPVNDVQQKQLRLIYSASLGLSSMAADVIEMARRGDQLVDTESVPFSIAETLESVVDMVRPIASEKGLYVRFSGPPGDQRRGRPVAISRVLLNLVTNALKFTDEGGVEVSAKVVSPTRVEFSVKDSGRGISPEALATLYQPFRKSSARTGRSGFFFSGTGLGLAMCRKLIAAMDSELKFETSPDEGTRFHFELDLPSVTVL